MDRKEAYTNKKDAELNEAKAKADQLEADAWIAFNDQKEQLKDSMGNMNKTMDNAMANANETMVNTKEKGSEAWGELKQGAKEAWKDMSGAINKAVNKLK